MTESNSNIVERESVQSVVQPRMAETTDQATAQSLSDQPAGLSLSELQHIEGVLSRVSWDEDCPICEMVSAKLKVIIARELRK